MNQASSLGSIRIFPADSFQGSLKVVWGAPRGTHRTGIHRLPRGVIASQRPATKAITEIPGRFPATEGGIPLVDPRPLVYNRQSDG